MLCMEKDGIQRSAFSTQPKSRERRGNGEGHMVAQRTKNANHWHEMGSVYMGLGPVLLQGTEVDRDGGAFLS